MVADRGLISADNVEALSDKGFGHILATRLHRDADVAAVLQASTAPDAAWEPCPEAGSAVCEIDHGGRRFIVASLPSATSATAPAPLSWWRPPRPSFGPWRHE